MAEKRRLNILVSPDSPSAEVPRTLMPEVLPNPRAQLRNGSARERTMRQLERLRAAGPKTTEEDDE
ncbi:MAG TPA: hypothetical protein PK156_03070 [Polyangium sp.]|nr:hypothetical protein [Polyangium sp.]